MSGCVEIVKPPEYDQQQKTILSQTFPSLIQWSHLKENAGSLLWYIEAKKKLKDPIIFVCHGNDDILGNWTLFPDPPRKPQPVREVARTLRNIYPNNPIVLIVCNPNGHSIFVEGVYYAKKNIYVTPDRYCNPPRKNTVGYIGSIDEFESPPIATYP